MKSDEPEKPMEPNKSRPTRGGWIEIQAQTDCQMRHLSRPTRGGWIEIKLGMWCKHMPRVPPHPGRVD